MPGIRAALVVPLLSLILMAAACSTGEPRHSVITTGPDGLRTFSVVRERDGNAVVCPAFGLLDPLTGILRGDAGAAANGSEPVWLESADGRPLSVVWPGGFTVRFDPVALLVDDTGRIVSREGERVTLDQVRPTDHAGTFADPYIASGALFGGCYPFTT